MTLCGLIGRLRWAEPHWLHVVLLGEEPSGPFAEAAADDPGPEMRTAAGVPSPRLFAEYGERSARYRDLLAGYDLSARARHPVRDGRHVDLRCIVLHLMEETARHNGHIDIVRGLLDGRTGD